MNEARRPAKPLLLTARTLHLHRNALPPATQKPHHTRRDHINTHATLREAGVPSPAAPHTVEEGPQRHNAHRRREQRERLRHVQRLWPQVNLIIWDDEVIEAVVGEARGTREAVLALARTPSTVLRRAGAGPLAAVPVGAAGAATALDGQQRLRFCALLVDVSIDVRLDEAPRRVRGRAAAEGVPGPAISILTFALHLGDVLPHRSRALIDADPVDAELCRQVLAHAHGHGAGALDVTAVVAGLAARRRRSRETPGMADGRVHKEIHGLAGDCRPADVEVLAIDAEDLFAVDEPVDVPLVMARGRLPLDTVGVHGIEERLVDVGIRGDGVRLVRVLRRLVLELDAVEKDVDGAVLGVVHALVPAAVLRRVAEHGARLGQARRDLQRAREVRLVDRRAQQRLVARHGLEDVDLRRAAALVRVQAVVRRRAAVRELLLDGDLRRLVRARVVGPGPHVVRAANVRSAREVTQ
mmetsp:Transcript_1937/g.5702  ORF Transcript_1937/g.5702 Transcript_1937/m.5702 type:complete len:469 (-) Transcript_1937:392-1798(-)